MLPFYLREVAKPDGRSLWLYGTTPNELPIVEGESLLKAVANSQLRWHPLRQEWVCYSAHRQGRTFKPPANYCPLCPMAIGEHPTEVPLADFEIAVFENRFAAFSLQSPPLALLDSEPKFAWKTQAAIGSTIESAIGQCEVVVYSAEHQASLGSLSQERRELLVQVWRDRYLKLLSQTAIQFVMPFENRGEEVGVTLHHPHGQIYAFSYVPPVVETMRQGFAKDPVLQVLRQKQADRYDVLRDGEVVAFVPPFMRYPYELWVTTESFQPGLWTYSDAMVRSLASVLGQVAQCYDALFQRPMPYIMVLYAAPKGAESYFQFHIQFLPFLRSGDRLKYVAGCETGAGTFLADILPEDTVEQLRLALLNY
jgi:UDPglucose--hexose-1-phosphate uridylyltransferase